VTVQDAPPLVQAVEPIFRHGPFSHAAHPDSSRE
jgi:hypothetical protein